MMLKAIIISFSLLGLTIKAFYLKSSTNLVRAHPLSTAGNHIRIGRFENAAECLIPRLEPGKRPCPRNELDEHVPLIIRFSLDTLLGIHTDVSKFNGNFIKNIGNILNNIIDVSYKKLRLMATNLLKKFCTASIVFGSSCANLLPSSVPKMRDVSIAASTVMATMGGSVQMASASSIKKYKDLTATQRLATTPVYFVCNSRGNAYLQEDVQSGRPEQKIVIYFMSSEDAYDYLNEMSQINSYNANEFRVMSVSMEKVMNQIQSKKQSRKHGRYDMDLIYRIQPSARQCSNAERVAGKGKPEVGAKAMRGISIPMFTAKGMTIKRGNGEIVTPYYFAYEDLIDDWLDMKEKSDERLPTEPSVVIRDFADVMCAAEGMTATFINDFKKTLYGSGSSSPQNIASIIDELGTPGIVPPRREIEMIKKYYRNRHQGRKNEFSKARIRGMQ